MGVGRGRCFGIKNSFTRYYLWWYYFFHRYSSCFIEVKVDPCKLPVEKIMARCEELLPGTPVEELLLGRLLAAAQYRLAEAKSRSLAQEGLTDTLFISLLILLSSDEGMQPSELSLMLGASRTSGTRVSDELVSRGWAVRREVQGDRRCQLLQLTDSGRAFLLDVLPRQRAWLRELWEPFAAGEREQLIALLRKVLQVVPE